MKIIFKCLLILFCSFNVYAADRFQGFAVKLGANFTNIDAKVSMDTHSLIFGGGTNLSIISNFGYHHTHTAGSLGLEYWENITSNFIFGVEAVGVLDNIGLSRDNNTFATSGVLLNDNLSVKLKQSIALLVKPGIKCNPLTVLYSLVGARAGYFKTSTNVDYSNSSGGPLNTGSVPITSRDSTKLGLTIGIGVEQSISDSFILGMEYAYTYYGNIKAPQTSAPIFSGGVESGVLTQNVNHLNVKTNTIGLILAYKF